MVINQKSAFYLHVRQKKTKKKNNDLPASKVACNLCYIYKNISDFNNTFSEHIKTDLSDDLCKYLFYF